MQLASSGIHGKLRSGTPPLRSAVPVRPTSGAASKGSGLGTGRRNPRLLLDPPFPAIFLRPCSVGPLPCPPIEISSPKNSTMATMSFGEHIEELRVRLILALIGLFVGVIMAFIPPLDLGWRVMKSMEAPAKARPGAVLPQRVRQEGRSRPRRPRRVSPDAPGRDPRRDRSSTALKTIAPRLELPPAEELKGKTSQFPAPVRRSRPDQGDPDVDGPDRSDR